MTISDVENLFFSLFQDLRCLLHYATASQHFYRWRARWNHHGDRTGGRKVLSDKSKDPGGTRKFSRRLLIQFTQIDIKTVCRMTKRKKKKKRKNVFFFSFSILFCFFRLITFTVLCSRICVFLYINVNPCRFQYATGESNGWMECEITLTPIEIAESTSHQKSLTWEAPVVSSTLTGTYQATEWEREVRNSDDTRVLMAP